MLTPWGAGTPIGHRMAAVVTTTRMASARHRRPPSATQWRKLQHDHPPGSSRIALARHYFDNREGIRPAVHRRGGMPGEPSRGVLVGLPFRGATVAQLPERKPVILGLSFQEVLPEVRDL